MRIDTPSCKARWSSSCSIPGLNSPTCGHVCRIVTSEYARRIVTFPRNVWHADHNIGTKDAVVVNFRPRPYDHANPDKYRLPLDTPLIPFKFPPGTRGYYGPLAIISAL